MPAKVDEDCLRAECAAAGIRGTAADALVLRVVGELRFDTIAAMLDKKETTVRGAFARASDRLRDYRERTLPDVWEGDDEE